MYTNINTVVVLELLTIYLQKYGFFPVPHSLNMEALELVINNNVFIFGDTFWIQLLRTEMGTPPALDWATLFFAIKKEKLLSLFLQLAFYKQYIDDILATWVTLDLHNNANDLLAWTKFNTCLNDFH